MLWSDEFNGASIDPSNWLIKSGTNRDAVNTPSAISLTSGNLVITTYTESGTHYTGFVSSADLFEYDYGYYEAYISFSDSAGEWSAFWLMTPSVTAGRNPPDPAVGGVEMDIVEHRRTQQNGADIQNQINSALHWNGYQAAALKVSNLSTQATLSNGGFHKYGMLWEPSGCTFYYDDVEIWTTSAAVSHHPENIILSSEVENASWAGSIPAGGYGTLATSTTKMTVDYVRVYKRNSALTGQGPATPQQPFPGAIEAEKFDAGGQDVAFFDLTGSDVDLQASMNAQSLTSVTSTVQPEWLEYTVNLVPGAYLAQLRVANGSATDKSLMQLSLDGKVMGETYVPPTGGYDTWLSYSMPYPLAVSKSGAGTFRVEFTNSGTTANFDSLQFISLGNVFAVNEAENAALAGGPAPLGSVNASGGLVVKPFSTGASATWSALDGFNGGTSTFSIRYASNNATSVTKELWVNGSLFGRVVFPPTKDWNTLSSILTYTDLGNVPGQPLIVPLNSGTTNTVEIRSIDNKSFYLDSLIASKYVAPVRLEGEAAAFVGTVTANSSQASGGKVVRKFNVENSSATWSNVSGVAKSAANLVIRYSRSTSPTNKSLVVNGVLQQLTFPPSASWSIFTDLVVPITLNRSTTNTIVIKNNGAADDNYDLYVDYIEVAY
jgi:beta-glucanase (GH16 family)